jgi:DNA-binding transcriptional MerR regulator
VELVSIGEFARLSRLSPKALRLYDELGLLPPASVDPHSGYRWYAPAQLGQARLVASLRQIGMPLAQIKTILVLDDTEIADRVGGYWARAEADHAGRRALVGYLIDRLNGKRSVMYEVATRQVPERRLLCLLRHADSDSAVYAMGKEFIGRFREKPATRLEGAAGVTFLILIYHGEVNADSDGPVEFCRPVPAEEAERLAADYPDLTLRSERAHEEAFVAMGSDPLSAAQWQLISENLRAWSAEHHRVPADLGVRVTYLAHPPITPDSRPDCDFAVPLR